MAKKFPELATQGVMMRKYGQEIIKTTAGKKNHGTGAVPGGVNKNLTIAERDGFLKHIDQMAEWARGALKIVKDYTAENLERLAPFGPFDSHHVALVREDGAMDLYHGRLRGIDAAGNRGLDDVDYQGYLDHVAEGVRSWSYMKFPLLKSLGPEKGWYRVGPLPRVNVCDFIDTPEAESARKDFMAVTDGAARNPADAIRFVTDLIRNGSFDAAAGAPAQAAHGDG